LIRETHTCLFSGTTGNISISGTSSAAMISAVNISISGTTASTMFTGSNLGVTTISAGTLVGTTITGSNLGVILFFFHNYIFNINLYN